ncbi:hypothetical protein [Cupriavidus sp. TMH.W2]|uniref:hypothetical protein n=1 Tax=Cupriavidus sp. TMH.W2 TaxID=3434465 RepID=UPI003D789493
MTIPNLPAAAEPRLDALRDAMEAILTDPAYRLLRLNGVALGEIERDLALSLVTGQHVWVLGESNSVIAPAGVHPFYAARIERGINAIAGARCFLVDADHASIIEVSRDKALVAVSALRYVTDSVHRDRAKRGWEYAIAKETPDYVTEDISETDTGGAKGSVMRGGQRIASFHSEAVSHVDANGTLLPAALICFRTEAETHLDLADRIALHRIAYAESAQHHLATTPLVSIALDGRELPVELGIGTRRHHELDVLRATGLRSSLIPHFLKWPDYAGFARERGNQDICDNLMNQRFVHVRNALRELGWVGESRALLHKFGTTMSAQALDCPTSYNRTNFTLDAKLHRGARWPLTIEVSRMDNDMSLTAGDFAARFDAAVSTDVQAVPTLRSRIEQAAAELGTLHAELAHELATDVAAIDVHGDSPDDARLSPVLARALSAIDIENAWGSFDMARAHQQGRVLEHWAASSKAEQFVVLSAASAATVHADPALTGWFVSADGVKSDACQHGPLDIDRRHLAPLSSQFAQQLSAARAPALDLHGSAPHTGRPRTSAPDLNLA